MTIKYGGHLQPGDFIAIAESGFMHLGWYFGEGKSGSLQYYFYKHPLNAFDYAEKNNKEFTLKSIWKSYVYGSNVGPTGSRVIKIENPESIFNDQKDLEAYLKSKEILNNLKFPAK